MRIILHLIALLSFIALPLAESQTPTPSPSPAEKRQAFGARAKQAMSELVFGKDIELRPHAIDRYGRTVAQVVSDNCV